jgi:hypothetical protein
MIHAESELRLAPGTLSATQLLLAPLPTLLTGLFPRTGTSLHGEQAADRLPLYQHIGALRTDSQGDVAPQR